MAACPPWENPVTYTCGYRRWPWRAAIVRLTHQVEGGAGLGGGVHERVVAGADAEPEGVGGDLGEPGGRGYKSGQPPVAFGVE
jgi:hypothetical protein